MPFDWLSGAAETRGEPHNDDFFFSFEADEHLSTAEASRYAPIIVEAADKSSGFRPYENDADVIYVQNIMFACEEEPSFSIRLASLYTIFNSDFLIKNDITCVVNMAGCNASYGAAMYYQNDLARYPELMEGVLQQCGSNITKLLEEGEKELKNYYKENFDIDWFAVEGAVDSWYYNIGQHFAETTAFMEKHLQDYRGKRRVNIVVNCYGGYNRSASVAIAFLLSRSPDLSLEDILRITCPRRPFMLSKHKWKPNKVHSKFLKELIEHEKTLHNTRKRHCSPQLHFPREQFDSCFHSFAFQQLDDECLSPNVTTQASDTPKRPFSPIPTQSTGDIQASLNPSDPSCASTEKFDVRYETGIISYWGQQWVRLTRLMYRRADARLPSFLKPPTRRGGVRKKSLAMSSGEHQQGSGPTITTKASDTPTHSLPSASKFA